jgi:hypothetical protein
VTRSSLYGLCHLSIFKMSSGLVGPRSRRGEAVCLGARSVRRGAAICGQAGEEVLWRQPTWALRTSTPKIPCGALVIDLIGADTCARLDTNSAPNGGLNILFPPVPFNLSCFCPSAGCTLNNRTYSTSCAPW